LNIYSRGAPLKSLGDVRDRDLPKGLFTHLRHRTGDVALFLRSVANDDYFSQGNETRHHGDIDYCAAIHSQLLRRIANKRENNQCLFG